MARKQSRRSSTSLLDANYGVAACLYVTWNDTSLTAEKGTVTFSTPRVRGMGVTSPVASASDRVSLSRYLGG